MKPSIDTSALSYNAQGSSTPKSSHRSTPPSRTAYSPRHTAIDVMSPRKRVSMKPPDVELPLQETHRKSLPAPLPSKGFGGFLDILVALDEKRYLDSSFERPPIFSTSILFSCLLTLIFILTLALGDGQGSVGFVSPDVNPMLGPSASTLMRFGGNMVKVVQQDFIGQGWRLISAGFLHVGAVHLFINWVTLIVFCPKLDRWMGSFHVVLLYLITSIGSQYTSALLRTKPVMSVGASGAVCGMLGAILADTLKHWHIIHLPKHQFLYWFIQTIVFLAFGYIPCFDNIVHVGGLFMGMAWMFLLPEHASNKQTAQGSKHTTLCLGGIKVKRVIQLLSLCYLLLVFVGGSIVLALNIKMHHPFLCFLFLSLEC